jgi:hypothetical protein
VRPRLSFSLIVPERPSLLQWTPRNDIGSRALPKRGRAALSFWRIPDGVKEKDKGPEPLRPGPSLTGAGQAPAETKSFA